MTNLHLVNAALIELLAELLGTDAFGLGLDVVAHLLTLRHLEEDLVELGLDLVGGFAVFQ